MLLSESINILFKLPCDISFLNILISINSLTSLLLLYNITKTDNITIIINNITDNIIIFFLGIFLYFFISITSICYSYDYLLYISYKFVAIIIGDI